MRIRRKINSFIKYLLFEKKVCSHLLNFLEQRSPRIAQAHIWYIESKKMNEVLHAKGYEALAEFHKVMLQNHIDYWLTAGTLLGIHREKKFIGHDLDIDVAIRSCDLAKTFTAIENSKIKLVSCFYTSQNTINEINIEYLGVKIDIFCSDLKENKECISVAYGDLEAEKLNAVTMFLPEVKEIIPVEVMGFRYMIPQNTHEYLIAIYGPRYMIPDKTWHFSKDLYSAKYHSFNELNIQNFDIDFLRKVLNG